MKKNFFIWVIVAASIAFFVYYYFISGNTEFNVNPDRFEELAKGNDVVILDVRSKFEFGGDKIAGAQNISYTASDFKSRIGQLDKDKTYLVYCATGSRSSGACKVLKDFGFKNIYNLKGGIEHWINSGKTVTR